MRILSGGDGRRVTMLKKLAIAMIMTLLLAAVPAVAADCEAAGSIDRQEAHDFALLLAKEYCARNHAGFMAHVSPAFAGDESVLSNAVRRDFLLLGRVDIRFTVMGVTSITDFAVISVNYQRTVVPLATGQTLNDSGVTEFVVAREAGELKLRSMKRPLLFGLSNPEAATGAVISGQNQHVIQAGRDSRFVLGPVY
jgi:hypothetical protein